jgi:hypothetical protein
LEDLPINQQRQRWQKDCDEIDHAGTPGGSCVVESWLSLT